MAATDGQYVIVCQGFPVVGMPCPEQGQYLCDYDPDGANGRGIIRWTPDITKALIFRNMDAAMDTWRLQSKRIPLRPDGQPNRPLTAYSIELAPVDKEGTNGS